MRVLYWLDVETTGLYAEHDEILELAISKAPFDRPFDATPVFHCVFNYENAEASLHPDVYEMHTENGLLRECSRSKAKPADVLPELLELLPLRHEPVLAGSSVHFDRAFLARVLPTFALRFSHRHYDVSAIKMFCESLGMPKLPKGEAHRAQADVLESIEHARVCLQWLRAQTAIATADAISKKLLEYA